MNYDTFSPDYKVVENVSKKGTIMGKCFDCGEYVHDLINGVCYDCDAFIADRGNCECATNCNIH